MKPITLKNHTLRLSFDTTTGALIGLTAVDTGWEALPRPELGLSFRLLVPTRSDVHWQAEGRRNNSVFGERQSLTRVDVSEDARQATFVWDGVVDQRDAALDIAVTLVVTLDDEAAVFRCAIDNRSPHMVENVMCPYLGGLRPPVGATRMDMFTSSYSDPETHSLWPVFDSRHGYFGVDHPSFLAKDFVPPSVCYVLVAEGCTWGSMRSARNV